MVEPVRLVYGLCSYCGCWVPCIRRGTGKLELCGHHRMCDGEGFEPLETRAVDEKRRGIPFDDRRDHFLQSMKNLCAYHGIIPFDVSEFIQDGYADDE